MGAFVSPKDTYKVVLTPEDCPCLDQEEWVEVQAGLNTKLMLQMQEAEGFTSGMVFLKKILKAWSFLDEVGEQMPLTDENIDNLQLDVVLHLLTVTQDKLPLANLPAPDETTPDS